MPIIPIFMILLALSSFDSLLEPAGCGLAANTIDLAAQPSIPKARSWKSRFVRRLFTPSYSELTEVMAMGRRPIWRVWYGKRLGIPQSFEDMNNFESAASFAAFVEADRLEVVRRTDPQPPSERPA
jgi:hypothetical protein